MKLELWLNIKTFVTVVKRLHKNRAVIYWKAIFEKKDFFARPSKPGKSSTYYLYSFKEPVARTEYINSISLLEKVYVLSTARLLN